MFITMTVTGHMSSVSSNSRKLLTQWLPLNRNGRSSFLVWAMSKLGTWHPMFYIASMSKRNASVAFLHASLPPSPPHWHGGWPSQQQPLSWIAFDISFSFFLFFSLLLRTLYHLSETSWGAATTYCLLEGHSILPHRCSNCSFNPTSNFWQSTHLHLCMRHWCFDGPRLCHCKNAGDDFVHSPLQGIGV